MKSLSRYALLGGCLVVLLTACIFWRPSGVSESSISPVPTRQARSTAPKIFEPKLAREASLRIGEAIQGKRRERALSARLNRTPYVQAESGRLPAAFMDESEIAERLDGFSGWLERYLESDAETRKSLEVEGFEAARNRRPAMTELIMLDPELAIDMSVPRGLRSALPRSVRDLLETPVSDRGRYDVITVCGFGEPGMADETIREVRVNGESRRVFTYGRRMDVTTKEELPFHGIQMDNLIAMHASPVRRMDPSELPAGRRLGAGEVAVEIGSRVLTMSDAEADEMEAELILREVGLGPIAGLGILPNGQLAPPPANSGHTEGAKTMLAIRVRFSDEPLPAGSPIDDATAAVETADWAVRWADYSYDRSSLTVTTTPVVASAQTRASHAGIGLNNILNDGEAGARAAGFEPDNYDFVTVLTKGAGHGYCGVAYVGGRRSHNVCFGNGTPNHEFGHNLGLRHANYNYTSHPTDPASQDPVAGSPDSPWAEYGHYYSNQNSQRGSLRNGRAHYGPMEKLHIDWLRDTEVTTVQANGTYRINQLDHRMARGVRALIVPSGQPALPKFWLCFRTAYTDSDWLSNSAQFDLTTGSYGRDGIRMLDMTPQSNDGPHGSGSSSSRDNNDKPDSGLLIGRTFYESRSDVYITPIGKGGARPDEWLDVRVNFGPFPLNRAPDVSVTPQFSQINAGESVTLTVNATDPEDDPVAFDWDFSDGTFDPAVLNQSVVTHSFSSDGIYVVSVNVSDMKGGTTVGTAIVKVGDASGNIVLIDDAVITEADDTSSQAVVTLTMVDPAVGVVTLDYATENGTATAGQDYTAASGTVTFNVGETTQSITLNVLGDVELEGDESFSVRLSNPSANAIIARARAAVTIVDNEIVLASPRVFSIDPLMGPIGSVVTITGSGFGLVPDQNIVYFGSVRARTLTATADMLTVEVPSGAIYAPVTVSFGGLSASSALPFVVTFDGDTQLDEMAFESPVDFGTGEQPVAVAVGDLDGDGSPELVTANFGSSSFSVFRNAATPSSVTLGTFESKQDFDAGVGPSEIGLVDIDGDGALDVVTVNQGAATLSVFHNVSTAGSIAFASRSDLAAGSNPSGLAFADVDSDGRVDIIVANEGSSSISVFPNRGVTGSITVNSFSSKVDFIVGTKPVSVAAGDLDGDGRPEIVAANSFNGIGGNSLTVLLNQGSGSTITKASFAPAAISPVDVGAVPGKVLMADFDPDDADPKLDVAVLNFAGNTVRILRNSSELGDINLTPSTFATGLAPRSMAIGDIDGDGAPDIAIANDDLSEVGLLRNNSVSPEIDFVDRAALPVNARPKNVVLGDLDQDGQPEIVTAHSADIIQVRRNAVRKGVNVAWGEPDGITFGTPLTGAQLNATATLAGNVPAEGTFVYSPLPGVVLPAGDDQVLTVTFVPLDTLNYSVTTRSVMIDVAPAPLMITPNSVSRPFGEPNPVFTATYDGFVNGDTEADLDTPAMIETSATQASPVGDYQILGMGAMDANYAITHLNPGTSLLTITKATPEIVWNDPADIRYGDELGEAQLNAMSPVEGVFTYTPSGGALEVGDGQTLSVLFEPNPEDAVNFTDAMATVTINVKRGIPAILWPNPADIMFGAALGEVQLNAMSSVEGNDFVYAPAAGTVLSAGGFQTLSVMFTPDDLVKYQPVTAMATINVLRSDADITWNDPEEIAFGTPLSATQLNAVSGIAGTLVYSPPLGAVLNAGEDQTLTVTLYPDDTANHNTVSMSVEIDVRKASPTITWAPPGGIAFGTALSGSQLNATVDFPGVLTYTPAAGSILNAGDDRPLSVSFTPNNPDNVESADTEVTIDVRTADPAITWADPADIVFGQPLTSAQLNPEPDVEGTFVFNPIAGTVLEAGQDQPLMATFSPSDSANYNTIHVEVMINVAKADPVIDWPTPADISFGTALAEGEQLNATASVPGDPGVPVEGSFAYTPADGTQLNTGTGRTLSAVFTPADTDNFNTVMAATTINVLKADATITWSAPEDIVFGTALGESQLNAVISGAKGSVVYDPPSGVVLNPGDDQLLRLTFTPDDTDNYNGGTAEVTLSVLLATPGVDWPTPQDIVFGTPLGASQLNASADVDGEFVYAPALGEVLDAGMGQTLSVTFTPDDPNYGPVSDTVLITVNKADPTVLWFNPADMFFGTPLNSVNHLNASASVPGDFAYTPDVGAIPGAGDGIPLNTTFTPEDEDNYNTVDAQVAINVLRAVPSIVWNNPANISFGDPLGAAQLNAVANSGQEGTYAYDPPGGALLNAGNFQELTVTFTPADEVNYRPATASVTINVLRAEPEITWHAPADVTYGSGLSGLQLNATANTAGTFSYQPPVGTVLNAGSSQILKVTFTPQDLGNFNATLAQTTLTVGKANLIARADNKSRGVSAPNPEFTATFLGFLNGDTEADFTQPLNLSTTATPDSPAGNYDILASGAASSNYEIQYRKGTLSVLPNSPPTVSLTAPGDGAKRAALSDVTLKADAADPDGSIVRVEFFEGANKLGEAVAPPYTLTWAGVPIGTYTLTAVATDNLNESTQSASVTLVVAPGVNSAAVSPEGEVTVGISGSPGVTYAIQASDNLINWITIGTFVATGDTQTFPDPDPADLHPQRFYRIIPFSQVP